MKVVNFVLLSLGISLFWGLHGSASPITTQVAAGKIDPWKLKQQYEFRYTVTIPPIKGNELRIWLPFPAEDKHQKVISYKIEGNFKPKLYTEQRYNNRMLYFTAKRSSQSRQIEVIYNVSRSPLHWSEVDKASSLSPSLFLAHNQYVRINNRIKDMAVEAVKQKNTQSAKIRALYDYVVANIRYNKEGKGWGQGDPIWACDAKRGNCTDFHSLYISMARYLAIPARFEIGVPLPSDRKSGEIKGYHCWAQAYDSQRTWIPFDASEAKKSGKSDAYYGTLPSDRILFSVGRNLNLAPKQNGPNLNFFIYPYAELDGKKFDGLQRKFWFKRI